ncbi:MAG: hypothetical protein JSV92_03285 [archaeon]|nr:MAG: hypothetical protein JSV92_03285 [archaeon]
MNVEEGVICEVCGDRAKVRMGKNRIKEVKVNPQDGYEEGDYVKIMMDLVVCKA